MDYRWIKAYAVRDGIVSHCGEVNENGIFPREDSIDLWAIKKPGEFSPYSWEGCIVKVSDKISFLGRDVEDSLTLQLLNYSELRELIRIIRSTYNVPLKEINNTVIIHELIIDLCTSSTPESGIRFSNDYYKFIKALSTFSYSKIYSHPRLDNFKKYARLVLESIFLALSEIYDGLNTPAKIKRYEKTYPLLSKTFLEWIIKYSNVDDKERKNQKYANKISRFRV